MYKKDKNILQPLVATPIVYSQPIQQPLEEICSIIPQSVYQWMPIINQYANQYGIDRYLVAAIIKVESNGNPDAYSSSGAVGLMHNAKRWYCC